MYCAAIQDTKHKWSISHYLCLLMSRTIDAILPLLCNLWIQPHPRESLLWVLRYFSKETLIFFSSQQIRLARCLLLHSAHWSGLPSAHRLTFCLCGWCRPYSTQRMPPAGRFELLRMHSILILPVVGTGGRGHPIHTMKTISHSRGRVNYRTHAQN